MVLENLTLKQTTARCCYKCGETFGELCQIFAAYVQKTARLRDKADLLVNEINVYASTETLHLKQGLKNLLTTPKQTSGLLTS